MLNPRQKNAMRRRLVEELVGAAEALAARGEKAYQIRLALHGIPGGEMRKEHDRLKAALEKTKKEFGL